MQAFIRVVKNFQQFSDKVEVVLLPKNTKWIKNTPEAMQRQAEIIKRIQQETGVNIRNYQDRPEVTPEMFSDTTHLARYSGDIAFTQMLVEDAAQILSKQE